MNRKLIFILFIILAFTSCRKSDYLIPGSEEIVRDNGQGTGTDTWTKDNNYILEGFVFVNENSVL